LNTAEPFGSAFFGFIWVVSMLILTGIFKGIILVEVNMFDEIGMRVEMAMVL